MPLVVQGPGIEELNLGGQWSEMDVAPTVLALLDVSSNTSSEGVALRSGREAFCELLARRQQG